MSDDMKSLPIATSRMNGLHIQGGKIPKGVEMERRDVLKLLASAAVLPPLSSDALFWLHGIHAQAARAAVLKTLTPDQDATVTIIAELIIPQTDTPGAKAAKVNEFIDLILSEWYDEATTARFLTGLADVDRRSLSSFGKKFIACSESDQKKLLTLLDEESSSGRKEVEADQTKRLPATDEQALSAKKEEVAPEPPAAMAPTNFFSMIKKLTLVGYYTSETGFKDELHKSIIPPTHKGCAVMPGVI